jgi:uncharacterized protein DUF3987
VRARGPRDGPSIRVSVVSALSIVRGLECSRDRCECQKTSRRGHGMTHCPCPGHGSGGDEHPSLSVTQRNATTLVHCFAGCSQELVIETLRDRGYWPGLAAPPTNTAANGAHRPRPDRPSIASRRRLKEPTERRWEIRDETGTLRAVHGRRDYPDGHVDRWWETPSGRPSHGDIRATELPLLGSEDLPTLPSDTTVTIVEGEPARDALNAMGIPSVATITGSGAVPCDDSLRSLLRFRVVLWPDTDSDPQKGTRHMERIAMRLAELGGSVTGMVRWNKYEGGDAADLALDYAQDGDPQRIDWMLARADALAVIGAADPSNGPAYDFDAGRDESTWAPPISLSADREVPAFPVGSFPAWLREYVTALAEATQTPLDLAGVLVLAVLATVAAGRVRIDVRRGWSEPTNLFIAVALASGERKSTVFRAVVGPIRAHEREESERLAPQIRDAETRRKIAEKRREQAQTDAARSGSKNPELETMAVQAAHELDAVVVPAPFRLLADDATPEATASLLADHGERIAILSPEGGVFDIMAGRYSPNSAPNLDAYLKGHIGDELRVDRKGRRAEHVLSPAPTLGLAVQPEVLRSLADRPGFRGRGLLARFLYSLPCGRVGTRTVAPPPVPMRLEDTYDTTLLTIARRIGPDDAINLRLSPDAMTEFQCLEWGVEPRLGESGDLGHIADWGGKLCGGTARIAALLHLAKHAHDDMSVPIEVDTVRKAIALAKYFTAHALAAFDLMGRTPAVVEARRVWRWIESNQILSFSERDCFQAHKSYFKRMEHLRATIIVLSEHYLIRGRPDDATRGRGRPSSPVYDVNPLAQNSHNPQNS